METFNHKEIMVEMSMPVSAVMISYKYKLKIYVTMGIRGIRQDWSRHANVEKWVTGRIQSTPNRVVIEITHSNV